MIKPMEERHIPAIARLEQACFAHPWSEQALRDELENEQAVFFVAEDETGRLMGYTGMHVVLGECYMDNLAVDPSFRHKGVGRALLQALIDWAYEHEGVFLTLEVRPSNEIARHLYTAMGLREVGRRPRYYTDPTEDALLMTVSFDSAVSSKT